MNESTIIILLLAVSNIFSIYIFIKHIGSLENKLMAKDLGEYKTFENKEKVNYNDNTEDSIDPFQADPDSVLEAFRKQSVLEQINNG